MNDNHLQPESDRLANDERARRMERLGLEAGDCYFSPEGYLVFTEQYHLKRGYCCQSGCRHCPYGFRAEQRKGIRR